MPFLNMTKVILDPDSRVYRSRAQVRHEPNDFGSRTPVIEDNPNWSGFSVIEWLRINTTDERKKYK